MSVQMESKNRVKFVRWPSERNVREECRERQHPCLLIVEHGAPPPEQVGLYEDWVRPPIVPADLQARVRHLVDRAGLNERPVLDSTGILYFRDEFVTLSPIQCEMLAPLIERFTQLVQRAELRDLLERNGASSSSNALDLHVMRLRRRLQLVGLSMRSVWAQGYVVEPR